MPLIAWIGIIGAGVAWAYLRNRPAGGSVAPTPSALPPPPPLQFTFLPNNRYTWVFWLTPSETAATIGAALANHGWVLDAPPALLGTAPITPAWTAWFASQGAVVTDPVMNRWHVRGLYTGPIQSTDEADVLVESVTPG